MKLLYLTLSLTDGASTELDALGDELLMDDDSSYLDEASTAPSIPEGLPGATSTNKVLQFVLICLLDILVYTAFLMGLLPFVFQDGVLVDEFGLPQIPAS